MNNSNSQHLVASCTLLLLLLTACTPLPPRLTPSGQNSSFSFAAGQPFSAYIDHYRTIIQETRTDLDGANREAALAANLPFELRPDPTLFPPTADGRYQKGIILIHGLSDSPFLMKSLGEHFRDRGYLVRAILLPGHGTRPGDLSKVKESDWRLALEYAAQTTGRQVEQLSLAGFSMGGALAVDYAIEHPGSITALFLFSPCLQVKSAAARWAGMISLFRTWLEIRDDLDYAKYESFPINAIVQIVTLTDRLGKLSRLYPERLSIPIFLAMSAEDETVDSAFTLNFFQQRMTNPSNHLILYSGAAALPSLPDPRISVVKSLMADRKILSLSHLALTIPPDDHHYGSQGDYRSCLHYPAGSGKYTDCAAGRALWFGEKTPANLQAGLLQRLSWNPCYTSQNDEIDRFISQLEAPPPAGAPHSHQVSCTSSAGF